MTDDTKTLRERATEDWAARFEGLTPDSLDDLIARAHPDIHFKDPFNDIRGHAALRRVFADMFEACVAPRFLIHDIAHGRDASYIRWRFTFTPRRLKGRGAWTIEGMSEVRVDSEGRITTHIDHWDAASGVLARLPGIGAFIRWLLCGFRA